MHLLIAIINAIVSIGSIVAALITLAKPQSISNSAVVTDGEKFFSRMYVVRAVPLGMMLAVLPFITRGKLIAGILFIGAFIQLADVVIGITRQKRGMIYGPMIAAILQIVCALFIW